MRIGATITCYNDTIAAKKLLNSLHRQTYPISKILIIDNSKHPSEIISEDNNLDVCFKHFPENIGISGALSVALEWAHENQIDWLWLFDQDSLPTDSALHDLILAIETLPVSIDKIGVVAPAIFDSSSGQYVSGFLWNKIAFVPIKNSLRAEPYECDAVISSGTLLNIRNLQASDFPSPKLFIDGVDFALCYNLRLRGLKIFVIPLSKLEHNLGTPKLIRIPFSRRPKIYYHLSPLRVFCICRNFSFIELKYSKWPYTGLVVFARLKHCLYFVIGALFGGQEKLKTIYSAISGTFQGFLGEKYWKKKPAIVP